MPDIMPLGSDDQWHVFTDGTCKRAQRQTFSAWAARAVHPLSGAVRQLAGAAPGGTSLWAEREAILQGLTLVPNGAGAHLYADIALSVIMETLESERGVQACAHLAFLTVHSVTRNTLAHQKAMHDLARNAEHAARYGEPCAQRSADRAALHVRAARVCPRDETRIVVTHPHHAQRVITLLGLTTQTTTRERCGRRSSRLLVTLSYLDGGQRLSAKAVSRDAQRGVRKALRCLLRQMPPAQHVTLHVPADLWNAASTVAPEFPHVNVQAEPRETHSWIPAHSPVPASIPAF